jgi:hypothetical protein
MRGAHVREGRASIGRYSSPSLLQLSFMRKRLGTSAARPGSVEEMCGKLVEACRCGTTVTWQVFGRAQA